MTADSSTVAEFIATHLAAKEVMWTRAILQEMGHSQENLNVQVRIIMTVTDKSNS